MKTKLFQMCVTVMGLTLSLMGADSTAVATESPYDDLPQAVYDELLDNGFFDVYEFILK